MNNFRLKINRIWMSHRRKCIYGILSLIVSPLVVIIASGYLSKKDKPTPNQSQVVTLSDTAKPTIIQQQSKTGHNEVTQGDKVLGDKVGGDKIGRDKVSKSYFKDNSTKNSTITKTTIVEGPSQRHVTSADMDVIYKYDSLFRSAEIHVNVSDNQRESVAYAEELGGVLVRRGYKVSADLGTIMSHGLNYGKSNILPVSYTNPRQVHIMIKANGE